MTSFKTSLYSLCLQFHASGSSSCILFLLLLLLLTRPSPSLQAPPPPPRLCPGLLFRFVLPPHLGDGLIVEFTSTGGDISAPPSPPPLNITACEIPAASVHSGRTVRSSAHRALEEPIFSRVYGQRWKLLKIVGEETL